MSNYTSPRNQDEREKIAWAAEEFRKGSTNDRVIEAYDAYFKAPLEDWKSKREAFIARKSQQNNAFSSRKVADQEMDLRARRWMFSVVDENGAPRSRELKPLLGGKTLVQVLMLPPIKQVELARKLFIQLNERADLQGDLQKLEEFKAATESLAVVAAAEHNAQRALKEASAEYQASIKTFGKGYSNLRKALELILGDDALARIFPVFSTGSVSDENSSSRSEYCAKCGAATEQDTSDGDSDDDSSDEASSSEN